MFKLGTEYGGWVVPQNLELNKDSVVFGVGVGEDISFDILLNHIYKCNVFLIDPTSRSSKHFEEVKDYKRTYSPSFSGDIQPDYLFKIQDTRPDFTKFTYINKGLWNEDTTLKFYKQTNPKYVSQSLISNMFGDEYDTVEVTTISKIMSDYGISKIDLIKMDIEGSEIQVLNNMLDNGIYPKYVLVEFDLKLKNKDINSETEKIISRLQNSGYSIFCNDNYNITFIKQH